MMLLAIGESVMAIRQWARQDFPLLALCVAASCAFFVGCRDSSKPASPEGTKTFDESVFETLEPYDPPYRIDSNGRIIHLNLEGRRIPVSAVDEVCKLTELRHLSLYAASVTDDSLVKLQSLQKLEGLGLGATPITANGLVHLKEITSLKWLWLSQDLAASKQAEDLKTAIPGLTIYGQ